ncbi:MAG: NAD-dependent epimerase/dehydratase family protein, partial [Lentisphaeraceae bacterium]|nr:NAD-dependent epimerase/dehydratase family protein [Lentisphaeraceae bacterium]
MNLMVNDIGEQKMRVLISGASGLLGQAIRAFLINKNISVVSLVRRPVKDSLSEIYWNPDKGELDATRLNGFDVVIHLSGENVASGFWTMKKKRLIMESRIKSTKLLATRLKQLEKKPGLFITASGINIYGHNDIEADAFDETSPNTPGDYLGTVVDKWEKACEPLRRQVTRLCHLRLAAVI